MRKTVIALAVSSFCALAVAAPLPVKLVSRDSPENGIDLVVEHIDGNYYAPAGELNGFSRLNMAALPNAKGLVNLTEIGSIRFDDLNSIIEISLKPEFLMPQVLGVRPVVVPLDEPLQKAVILDYNTALEKVSGRALRSSTTFDASTYFGLNRLDVSGFAVSESGNSKANLNRLKLTREDLANSSQVEVGTINSKGGSKSAMSTVVGVGIGKNRSITPGFITGPQLKVDGFAASKSTVEILFENQKNTVSQSVLPGPFSVTALPSVNGSRATVIVKDEAGLEHTVTADLFANPELLAVGQSEYSLSAGKLKGVGLSSRGFVAQGYYRRGVTNWLTLESGFEVASKIEQAPAVSRLNLAADFSTLVGDFSLSLKGVGGPMSTALSYNILRKVDDWTLSASGVLNTAQAGYANVGDGYAQNKAVTTKIGTAQASRGHMSLFGTAISSDYSKMQVLGACYKIESLNATIQARATRFTALNSRAQNSYFVGLSFPLDKQSSISTSTQNTIDGQRKTVSASTAIGENYNVGGSLEGINKLDSARLSGFARFDSANAQVTVAKTPYETSIRSSVAGSVMYHDGKFMAMRPLNGEGFALFDLSVPDVKVRNGAGQNVLTDEAGFAVVPLRGMRNSQLSIDADTAPDGLDLTTVSVTPRRRSGVIVSRRVIKGQFVQVAGNHRGQELVVGGQRFVITDRGAWVELPAGDYIGVAGSESVPVKIR